MEQYSQQAKPHPTPTPKKPLSAPVSLFQLLLHPQMLYVFQKQTNKTLRRIDYTFITV